MGMIQLSMKQNVGQMGVATWAPLIHPMIKFFNDAETSFSFLSFSS